MSVFNQGSGKTSCWPVFGLSGASGRLHQKIRHDKNPSCSRLIVYFKFLLANLYSKVSIWPVQSSRVMLLKKYWLTRWRTMGPEERYKVPEFSRNNGRISSKSLEKSLDGVNTARLQPGDFCLTDLCQRERGRESTETHGIADSTRKTQMLSSK